MTQPVIDLRLTCEQLTAEGQAHNRQAIRDLPAQLAEAGFRIYRLPSV